MADVKLTPTQLAEELDISPQTLANWRWANTGPRYIKLGTAKNAPIRYRRTDVDAWLVASESRAAA
ncbi:helix-turn-helix transcriptional regulator [Streptomyces sp. NPDC058155]|uniref:helix-turn-helix transcriptional regulator n=1 Tax=Streptomyces sp. NPDC058155 TaxID=3346359 RepID=UPI0036E8ED91